MARVPARLADDPDPSVVLQNARRDRATVRDPPAVRAPCGPAARADEAAPGDERDPASRAGDEVDDDEPAVSVEGIAKDEPSPIRRELAAQGHDVVLGKDLWAARVRNELACRTAVERNVPDDYARRRAARGRIYLHQERVISVHFAGGRDP